MAGTAHGRPRVCRGSSAVNATHAEQAAERALLKPLAGDRMEDDHDNEEGQPDPWAKEPHDGHRKAVERHADHRAQALSAEVLRSGGRLQQLRVVTQIGEDGQPGGRHRRGGERVETVTATRWS